MWRTIPRKATVMTVIWLIVWLCSSTPSVHAWNAWLISLLICAFLDLTGARARL